MGGNCDILHYRKCEKRDDTGKCIEHECEKRDEEGNCIKEKCFLKIYPVVCLAIAGVLLIILAILMIRKYNKEREMKRKGFR